MQVDLECWSVTQQPSCVAVWGVGLGTDTSRPASALDGVGVWASSSASLFSPR